MLGRDWQENSMIIITDSHFSRAQFAWGTVISLLCNLLCHQVLLQYSPRAWLQIPGEPGQDHHRRKNSPPFLTGTFLTSERS
jgi:hypothetical protein